MKKSEKDQLTIIYLNLILASNFVIACLDEMESTKLYRHNLKHRAKAFMRELERVTADDMNNIWGIADEELYEILDKQQELLKVIARSRPETCIILLKMVEKFQQAPDAIINWLGLKKDELIKSKTEVA